MHYYIKKTEIPIILISMGFFVTPYLLRAMIFGYEIASFNALAVLGVALALCWKNIRIDNNNTIAHLIYLLCLLFSVFLIFYVSGNGWGIYRKILNCFVIVMPMLLIFCNFKEDRLTTSWGEIWYKFLRFFSYLLIIMWLYDSVFSKPIQRAISDFYTSGNYLIKQERFFSIYGHSLDTSMVFMMFVIWTLVYRQIHKSNKSYFLDLSIGVLGIVLTGTKSGVLGVLVLLLFYHTGFKYLKYMIVFIIAGIVAFEIGIFDNVIERILEGIKLGDVSSYRNTAISIVLSGRTNLFHLWSGNAIDYSDSTIVAAFEYPILGWSYMCGIMFTIVMYISFFVITIVKFIKKKNWRVLICILYYIAYINGNNGIMSFNDNLLFYAVNAWLLLATMDNKELVIYKKKGNGNS